MEKIPSKRDAGESKGRDDKPPRPVGHHLHRVVVQQPPTDQSARSASSAPHREEDDSSGTHLGKRKRELALASSTGHKTPKAEGERETPVLRPVSEDLEAWVAPKDGETVRQRCDRVFASALGSRSAENLEAIGQAMAHMLGGPSADAAVRAGAVEALVLAMRHLPDDPYDAHDRWVKLAQGMGRGFSSDGEPIAPAFFKLLLEKSLTTSTFAEGAEFVRWKRIALDSIDFLPDQVFQVMHGTPLDEEGLQVLLDAVFPHFQLPDGDRRKNMSMRRHATWATYFFRAVYRQDHPQRRLVQALRHLVMTSGNYAPDVGMHHFHALFRESGVAESRPGFVLQQILALHEHLQDIGCAAWALAVACHENAWFLALLDDEEGEGEGMSRCKLDPMGRVTLLLGHCDLLSVDQEVRLIEGLLWLRERTDIDETDNENNRMDFDAPMRAAISHIANRCSLAQLVKLALSYAKATGLAETAGAQAYAISGMLPPVPEVETKAGYERRVQRTAELRSAIEAGFGLRGNSPLKAASIADLSDPEKLDLIRTGYELESFGAEQVREHIDMIALLDLGPATRSEVYATVFGKYPSLLNETHLSVARTHILDHIVGLAQQGCAIAPDTKFSRAVVNELVGAKHLLEEVYEAFETGSGLDFAMQQMPPAPADVRRHRTELTAYAGVLKREIAALERNHVPELVRQTLVFKLRTDLALVERALQTPEPSSSSSSSSS